MYNVYLITYLTTGKKYVGYTKKSFSDKYYGSGRLITNLIAKNTPVDKFFKKELLEECNTRKNALEREDFWIKKLNTLHPNGYNVSRKGKYTNSQNAQLPMPIKPREKKYESLLKLGNRFGSWVVSGAVGRDERGRVIVVCKCDCGKTQLVYGYQLVNSKTTQCKDCSSGKTPTKESYANKVYRTVIGSREAYNISPTSITKTYTVQNEKCALTGAPIPLYNATAVRWDNSQNFSTTNTLITSKQVQKILESANMDAKTFVGFCGTIVNNNPAKVAISVQEFFDRRSKDVRNNHI